MKTQTSGIIELSVARLRERCDPFAGHCWHGLDRPITVDDVARAIRDDNLVPPLDRPDDAGDGKGHAARVAWFVVHGWNDPLGVDVGVPSLGCRPFWPVVNGNHRWAAALYRGDRTVRAEVDGAVDEIDRLVAAPESEDEDSPY